MGWLSKRHVSKDFSAVCLGSITSNRKRITKENQATQKYFVQVSAAPARKARTTPRIRSAAVATSNFFDYTRIS
jgi:hypothetical protein